MNEDINANIIIQGKCKKYPVFYGKTSISGAQNYAVTFDPYGDDVTRVNLNIKTDTGKISINKTDDETHKPIKGVTFQLTKEDGTVIANATTNENGIATFSSLYQGKYILKETATNEKYILNTKEFDVDVEYNKTTTVNIENEHKKGNVKVYKIDKDNNRVVLGNVEFELYSHEFEKVIGTYYTDVDGELLIENLRIGDYSLIETKTNKWYNLASDTDIEIEWNLTKELQIENELKKGAIKIIKVDKDDNEVKLENVKFNVMDKDGNILEQLTTDEKGIAISKELLKGNYTIKETKAPVYYNINQNTFSAEIVNHKEIVNVDIEDESVDIKVQVEKTGFIETQSKDTIYYDFKNIKNNSNVQLDTFNWQDTLPTNALRLEKIFTGTWNQKLTYSVWYKTNLNDYKMIRDNLDTYTNYEMYMEHI